MNKPRDAGASEENDSPIMAANTTVQCERHSPVAELVCTKDCVSYRRKCSVDKRHRFRRSFWLSVATSTTNAGIALIRYCVEIDLHRPVSGSGWPSANSYNA